MSHRACSLGRTQGSDGIFECGVVVVAQCAVAIGGCENDVSVDVQSVVKPQGCGKTGFPMVKSAENQPSSLPNVASGEATVLMGLTACLARRSGWGPEHGSARPSLLVAARVGS